MVYEVIDDQNMINKLKKGKCPFCNKNTVNKIAMVTKAITGKFGPSAEFPTELKFDEYMCSNIECEKYNVELLVQGM